MYCKFKVCERGFLLVWFFDICETVGRNLEQWEMCCCCLVLVFCFVENYLSVFGIYLVESYFAYLGFKFVRVLLHQFVLFQIWYRNIFCHHLWTLPNHQFCLLSFRLIFLFPIIFLKIFFKSKTFSQLIMIIFEVPPFYNSLLLAAVIMQ